MTSPTGTVQLGESDSPRTSVIQVPAALVRGGTSKCWIFRQSDLPADTADIERLLIRTFGSPDLRQIDGVGGASSTTSKAIIVDDLGSADGVVNYRFAQVAIDKPSVEWDSNCGNCATGLGLYALHARLVPPADGVSRVTIVNTVTGLSLVCEVPTPGGEVPTYGSRQIPGQYYPGVPVDIIFESSSWTSFETEMPTGHAVDEVTVQGRTFHATLIDAGAPAAIFDPRDFGFTGSEDAEELEERSSWAPELRAAAAKVMGIPSHLTSIPKVGIVGPPPAGETGVSARMISMGALHPAIGLTSAVAIAAASGRAGSIVANAAVGTSGNSGTADNTDHDGGDTLAIHLLNGATRTALDAPVPRKVAFQRSARVISEGTVLVPGD